MHFTRSEHPAHAGRVRRPICAANGATSRTKCESKAATATLLPEERAAPEGLGLAGAALEAAHSEGRVEPELRGLVRAQAPIRRVLAVLAGRFVSLQAWERLGFARLGDYATERLGLSGRHSARGTIYEGFMAGWCDAWGMLPANSASSLVSGRVSVPCLALGPESGG